MGHLPQILTWNNINNRVRINNISLFLFKNISFLMNGFIFIFRIIKKILSTFLAIEQDDLAFYNYKLWLI